MIDQTGQTMNKIEEIIQLLMHQNELIAKQTLIHEQIAESCDNKRACSAKKEKDVLTV